MSIQRTFLSLGLLAGLGFLVAFSRPATAPAASPVMSADASGTYAIDAGHSFVTFATTHLGVSYAYGRFNEVGGSFTLDEADPSKSEIRVVIQAKSIDTNSEGRDKHLRGSDFFDAEQFPEVSTAMKLRVPILPLARLKPMNVSRAASGTGTTGRRSVENS